MPYCYFYFFECKRTGCIHLQELHTSSSETHFSVRVHGILIDLYFSLGDMRHLVDIFELQNILKQM